MLNRNNPMRVNRRRKKNPFVPILLWLLVALLVALIIAAVWQVSAEGSSNASSSAPQSVAELSPAPAEVASSSAPPEPEPPVFEGAVPESERVQGSYFDDAVFVGDSITTGIELYGVMKSTNVIAETGANLLSVYTREAIKQEDGTRITIIDALAKKQYKKVYVMLGGNEVRDEEKSSFVKRYGKLIDSVKELQPDAVCYIQSILPVTKVNNYKMDNARIDEFNEALMALCAEKKVYYLNVAESMKDESGMLPDEASPADGMHFTPAYYNKWFEYLKTHTVPQTTTDQQQSTANSSSKADSSSPKNEVKEK